MHTLLPLLLAMVAVILLLEMWAGKIRVAYPVVLVIAGLLISFIPGLPRVTVDPDMIFFMFLPPLLFEAAWSISFKELKKWYRIITSFAFLVVLFTALSVAVTSWFFIPGFTLALGFVLGGIVSPPDAVSTGAITKFVKIPRVTSTVLQGESLFNDASSLIIFRFAVIAVGTGQFVWHDAALNFVWMVTGGAGIGLLLGWFFVKAHKWLPTEASSDVILTLIEPYCMYWVAEQLHSSGVLAVVVGGLYMSTHRLVFLNSASRIQGQNVWESVVFILNGLVFFMIGLDLPEIVGGMRKDGIPLWTGIQYGLLVTATLIVARIISAYAALIATRLFRPQNIPHAATPRRTLLMPLLLGWTGMRGVVSLAAALSIPVLLDNGSVFPHRHLILFITFLVILLTLVVQGLTLPVLIRKSRIYEDYTDHEKEQETRRKMKQGLKMHIYQFLRTKYENEMIGHAGMEKILKQWEERALSQEADSTMSDQMKGVFVEALQSQRKYLNELNKDPEIDEEIIREQLFQIDLEEERLKRI